MLHAIFVKRHEQTIIFDQAFDLFWQRRGYLDTLMAAMAPIAQPRQSDAPKPRAGATRVADALAKPPPRELPKPKVDLDARLTVSTEEMLRSRDFAQMSAAEIALAEAAIARLRLPDDRLVTRRWRPASGGSRIDARRSFAKSLRAGGASIDLAFRERIERPPPIVAICDISGSMSDYTRVFLHFLHALTARRRRVHAFLFGTRLTNVTRALRSRDIDEALAACSLDVRDWSGGTQIGASLHRFNRLWSRRVLGQGAIVILFTDGLEREGTGVLEAEMTRLHKSCRTLIWVNPLLRYEQFQAKAAGIRAMLPHVDRFRPIHNLASMAALCAALTQDGGRSGTYDDPRAWLGRVA